MTITRSLNALKIDLRNLFDFGIKHQHQISDSELELSGRDEKMYDVIQYLASRCDARLMHEIINDLGSRMERILILPVNHMKARIYIRMGIDIRDKKFLSMKDIYSTAKWLEKYQDTFLGVNIVSPEGKEPSQGEEGGNVNQSRIPWTTYELDETIDKVGAPSNTGIFDKKLDLANYIWLKTHQTQVSRVKCQLGHYHKGIIKFIEINDPGSIPFILSRACWNHKFQAIIAACKAIEALSDTTDDIPMIATYWREFALELERIKNHVSFLVTWFDLAGEIEIANRNKELLQQIVNIEALLLDDNKIPWITPGGMSIEPRKKQPDIITVINTRLLDIEKRCNDELYRPIIQGDLFTAFNGIGRVSKTVAFKAGLTGPSLRASGLPLDSRKDFPEGIHSTGLLKWDTCVGVNADVKARIEIHAHEIIQSLRMVYQLLNLIDDEPTSEAQPGPLERFLPNTEGFSLIEGSEGELHCYARSSLNGKQIHTIRLQSPSFLNFTAVESLFNKIHLRKLPWIIHSFNPCWNCIDM